MAFGKFTCLLCPSYIGVVGQRRAHMQLHSVEATLSCRQCNTSFKGSCDLWRHMLSHTRTDQAGSEPPAVQPSTENRNVKNDKNCLSNVTESSVSYTCDVCQKVFEHNWQQQVHVAIHFKHARKRNAGSENCTGGVDDRSVPTAGDNSTTVQRDTDAVWSTPDNNIKSGLLDLYAADNKSHIGLVPDDVGAMSRAYSDVTPYSLFCTDEMNPQASVVRVNYPISFDTKLRMTPVVVIKERILPHDLQDLQVQQSVKEEASSAILAVQS